MTRMKDVSEVSEVLGLRPATVRDLIATRALAAVNVAPGAKVPRWRVSDESLQAFLRSRATIQDTDLVHA